ncbi:lytic murein transglycosylase [Prosthecomicrobium sp. N25]|uniref:lytic murein transglycosylase n=1 Tax=Prosthecomicrobium sp. N25 TaxID=3129254 RepID=UPI0030779848
MTIERPNQVQSASRAGAGPGLSRRSLVAGGAALAALPASAGLAVAQVSDYAFAQWVQVFRPRVLAKGVSAATYDRVMNAVTPDTEVYKFDKSQPEVQEPIWRYLNRRVNEWRINTGRERVKAHADLFGRIEQTYGVDRYMLCALWGMESAYGDVITNPKFMRKVIPCLAALAWGDPRRRTYWEQELTNALVIVDRGWAQPDDMIGSWAGAMGHTQWMPEVWLAMGVDFDRDGRINPFGKPDDALAGTARYLLERGKFQRGQTWGYEVRLPANFNAGLADGKTIKTTAQWKALGVTRANGEPFPRDSDNARLALPAGVRGPAFMYLQNLFAIRSYNPSTKYALAIGHLADRIRGSGDFLQPWPTDEKPLSLEEAQELQTRLTQLGFDTGGTDGRVGEKTQAAVQAWQKSVGMTPADGFPSDKVLKRLRGG